MKIYRKIVRLFLIISSLTIVCAQPLQNRILIASSYDGLNWQKLNIIATDSGDVPDAVIGPSGAVYFFHQGLITPYIDGIKVGISQNGINNWQFYQVQIPGTGTWPGRPCDPDVIMFGDTFRLYFTGDPINDGYPETYSAISFDGINFTRENGIRFEVSGSPVLDPSLLWTGDTLQYFAGGAPPGQNWHAHSLNGLDFIQQPNFSVACLMMANGIQINPDGYYFYCFSNQPNDRNISSVYSPDGQNWILVPGYRLQLDTTNPLEYLYVKDPAIVYKDSIYIMYYVTRKRGFAVQENKNSFQLNIIDIVPNPSHGTFVIKKPILNNCSVKIFIYNSLGNLVKEIKTVGNAELHITNLKQGIYFIVLENNRRTFSKKAVIMN